MAYKYTINRADGVGQSVTGTTTTKNFSYNFPENKSYDSDIVYNVIVEDDDGCTTSTTMTVPKIPRDYTWTCTSQGCCYTQIGGSWKCGENLGTNQDWYLSFTLHPNSANSWGNNYTGTASIFIEGTQFEAFSIRKEVSSGGLGYDFPIRAYVSRNTFNNKPTLNATVTLNVSNSVTSYTESFQFTVDNCMYRESEVVNCGVNGIIDYSYCISYTAHHMNSSSITNISGVTVTITVLENPFLTTNFTAEQKENCFPEQVDVNIVLMNGNTVAFTNGGADKLSKGAYMNASNGSVLFSKTYSPFNYDYRITFDVHSSNIGGGAYLEFFEGLCDG